MIREEIMAVKEEVNELKHESFAYELLKDFKKQNKRQFIIILVILTMWFATIGYLVYILNDIGSTEETIDIEDVQNIDNSHIRIGDELWEKSK